MFIKFSNKGFAHLTLIAALFGLFTVGLGVTVYRAVQKTNNAKDVSETSGTIENIDLQNPENADPKSQDKTEPTTDKPKDSEPKKDVSSTSNYVTVISPKKTHSIKIPKAWISRKCNNHDGTVLKFLGGYGGTEGVKCKTDDATWPTDHWKEFGNVVIGTGSNPFARNETAKKTYGNFDKYSYTKYTYTITNKEKDKVVNVTEYVIGHKVAPNEATIKVFTGEGAIKTQPSVSDKEILSEVEKNLSSFRFLNSSGSEI
jgi:hypothetical protein